MLARDPERLSDALNLLDPAQRALLELSLHRDVADPALAELLRTDVDTVVEQRADALQRLGDVLDASPAEIENALIQYWRGEPEEGSDAEETADPRPQSPDPSPQSSDPGPQAAGRRRAPWVALMVVAAVGLVLVLVVSGGGDDEEPEETGPPASTETQAEQPPPPDDGAEPVDLDLLAGSGDAGGTARIVGSGPRPRLELRLRGLSDAAYSAWLYDSIAEARPLASFRGPEPFVKARLPEGFERFRYIDVSQEPEDGNPNHSGASVLRVPTEDLRAR